MKYFIGENLTEVSKEKYFEQSPAEVSRERLLQC